MLGSYEEAMEELIDLGDIADSVSERFPNIKGLYLFGSRAFGTGSPRSDIDILVEFDGHIRPADLRDFTSVECEALDLFLVEGGKAISSQNESYVESGDISSLISTLNAKKFWDKESGRLQIDIPWKQRVRTDVTFIPSALPMRPESPSTGQINPETLTLGVLFKAFTVKQITAFISSIVVLLGATFGGGYWIGTNTVVIKDKVVTEKTVKSTEPNKQLKATAKSAAP